ncbi:helix-turn-helix domain-containing protein [Streptomyces sp. NPDC052095]|uniref:helix-turn-helix domain-containing protein n=1 Tax=unclassified Streptomyces TaxID=2593676 RepID=UPI00344FDCBC
MPRWKELPAELTTSEHQLLVQLRRLKDHSDLSLAALAGRTSYSRSSWERYLNGKKPVPRKAVEELAQVCGTDPTRLVVLYDVAERARAKEAGRADEVQAPEGPESGDAGREEAPSPEPDTEPATEPVAETVVEPVTETVVEPVTETVVEPVTEPLRAGSPRREGRTVPLGRAIGAAVVAVAVAFGAGMLAGGARSGTEARKAHPGSTVAAGAGYLRGQTYPCEVRREHGELRAGHSGTREMLLDINSTGFDVVEAQCLLREKGFDPGATDGLYDERSKGAAKKFQQAHRLVVDGIIGPDTWRELRR